MKFRAFFNWFIFFCITNNCFAQSFKIDIHYLEKEIIGKTKDSIFLIYNDKPFYEDKTYSVEKYCKGEWGGCCCFYK